jgi:hypothetical protein
MTALLSLRDKVTIPQYASSITLGGHQAKILVTDFVFGSKTLLYSTAEVLTYAVVDGKEILAIWAPAEESFEFSITGVESGDLSLCGGCVDVDISSEESGVTVSFAQNAGLSLITFDDGSRVVVLDRSAAYLFWSPSLSIDDPTAPPDQTGELLHT